MSNSCHVTSHARCTSVTCSCHIISAVYQLSSTITSSWVILVTWHHTRHVLLSSVLAISSQQYITNASSWVILVTWHHTRGALLSFVFARLSLVPLWIWLNKAARPGLLGGIGETPPDKDGRFVWGGGGGGASFGGGGRDLGGGDA